MRERIHIVDSTGTSTEVIAISKGLSMGLLYSFNHRNVVLHLRSAYNTPVHRSLFNELNIHANPFAIHLLYLLNYTGLLWETHLPPKLDFFFYRESNHNSMSIDDLECTSAIDNSAGKYQKVTQSYEELTYKPPSLIVTSHGSMSRFSRFSGGICNNPIFASSAPRKYICERL